MEKGGFMSQTAKCAHPACTCVPSAGKSYCSETCSDEKKMTEIACQCKHPECQGTTLTA